MSQPYIGEIRMFAGSFAPAGWMFCQGQTLAISEYEALYALIGTSYGGDGQTSFLLPDLRGRLPLHQGSGFALGASGGAESVTLTTQQIPLHGHALVTSQASADQSAVSQNMLAAPEAVGLYSGNAPNQTLAAKAIGDAGGGLPHNNLQPYLCVSFIISLFGVFPSQS